MAEDAELIVEHAKRLLDALPVDDWANMGGWIAGDWDEDDRRYGYRFLQDYTDDKHTDVNSILEFFAQSPSLVRSLIAEVERLTESKHERPLFSYPKPDNIKLDYDRPKPSDTSWGSAYSGETKNWFRRWIDRRQQRAKEKNNARFLDLAHDWPHDVVERYLDWETLPDSYDNSCIPEGYLAWNDGLSYAELRRETKTKIMRRENSGIRYQQKFPQPRRLPKRTNGL